MHAVLTTGRRSEPEPPFSPIGEFNARLPVQVEQYIASLESATTDDEDSVGYNTFPSPYCSRADSGRLADRPSFSADCPARTRSGCARPPIDPVAISLST